MGGCQTSAVFVLFSLLRSRAVFYVWLWKHLLPQLATYLFILVDLLAQLSCLVNCSFHVENYVRRPVGCFCLIICFYDTDLALVANWTYQK